jgi:hypothetical protein
MPLATGPELCVSFLQTLAFEASRPPWRGYRWVILITFLTLPARALIAASLIEAWGVWPVQVLDGIGSGLQSVAVPALVVRLLNGAGRVNVGQGVVMIVQAAGAALSPALGGLPARQFGHPAAFISLGAILTGSLALWPFCGTALRHVGDIDGVPDRAAEDSTPSSS